MLSVDTDHILTIIEGRRWFIHLLANLVWAHDKAEILPLFRARLPKDGERTASDLLNKAYAKQPLRRAHIRALLAAINELNAAKGIAAVDENDVLIGAYFQLIHLDRLLRDIGMTEFTLPHEGGVTAGLLSDLVDGARTTLFTALLVMRIINRVRHDQGKSWLDPRWYIRTEVKKGKIKLKVAAAADSLVEKASYEAWMPHKDQPKHLNDEDGPNKGQATAEAPLAETGEVVPINK